LKNIDSSRPQGVALVDGCPLMNVDQGCMSACTIKHVLISIKIDIYH
jgi:hypothetical protein